MRRTILSSLVLACAALPQANVVDPSAVVTVGGCLIDGSTGIRQPIAGVTADILWVLPALADLGLGYHAHELTRAPTNTRPLPLFALPPFEYTSVIHDVTDATGCTQRWDAQLPGIAGQWEVLYSPTTPNVTGSNYIYTARAAGLQPYDGWLYNGQRLFQGALDLLHGNAPVSFTATTSSNVRLGSQLWYDNVVNNPFLKPKDRGAPLSLMRGSLPDGGLYDYEPLIVSPGCPTTGLWCTFFWEEHAQGTEVDFSNIFPDAIPGTIFNNFQVTKMMDFMGKAGCRPGQYLPGTIARKISDVDPLGPEHWWLNQSYTHFACEPTARLSSVCDIWGAAPCTFDYPF